MGFFDSLDRSEGRAININWENELSRIADSYPYGIAHGVQKDAVQNGWDARLDKKSGRRWKFVFELHEIDGHRFVSMTDCGTHGLTGRVLQGEDLTADLPIAERWGRFENLAFTKDPSKEALGARGQGKFIFVAASNTHCIVYDSRRSDGSYRLGTRAIRSITENLSWSWDGEEAGEKLRTFCETLRPLTRGGTRVIIDDPIDELVDDLISGRFLANIEDTWWEVIEKHNAKIGVVVCGRMRGATGSKGEAIRDRGFGRRQGLGK